MGTAAYGGKGFKEKAAVSGERPIGAASCRQQHNQTSCHTLPPNRQSPLPWPPLPTGPRPAQTAWVARKHGPYSSWADRLKEGQPERWQHTRERL